MQHNIFIFFVLALTLALGACSSGEQDLSTLENRLAILEASVSELRDTQAADRTMVTEELAKIRTNLSLALDVLAKQEAELDQPLGGKAKELAKDSMERLLKMSRDILDQLEDKLSKLPEPGSEESVKDKTEI